MREEIAIQRPAALHKLPGIHSGQQHCHQGDPFKAMGQRAKERFNAQFTGPVFAQNIERIYLDVRKGDPHGGDQYHRQTHRYRVESEQFDKGDHAIGKENAHLTVSPGSKMNRQKSTISVGSVF